MTQNKRIRKSLKKVFLKPDFTIMDLYKAYYECRRRKRNSISSIEFEFNLEHNMMQLYEDLKNGNYKIGKSICFVVLKPKPREVWAASFRDRIVHHLIYNAIKDRFYAVFIKDTFSCIPKRGTLNAAKKLEKYARAATENYTKNTYYLKADLKNFFVSIDKDILFKMIKERIPEEWLQKLVEQIIYHDPKKNVILQSPSWKFKLLPSYKSLWNTNYKKGLPIGNLTSQFFSNIYLNKLDQFVKHKLRCKYYCRYVDDFIIIHESSKFLNYCYDKIAEYINNTLLIEIHKDKKTINFVRNGIDFVGYVIKPNRFYLRQRVLKNIFKIINLYEKNVFDLNESIIEHLFFIFNSFLGMLRAVKGYNLRRKICNKVSFPFYYAFRDFTCVRQAFLPIRKMKYAQ